MSWHGVLAESSRLHPPMPAKDQVEEVNCREQRSEDKENGHGCKFAARLVGNEDCTLPNQTDQGREAAG